MGPRMASSRAASSATKDRHGAPSTRSSTSPACRPAAAAGPCGSTSDTTSTPRSAPSARIRPSTSRGRPSRTASSYVWCVQTIWSEPRGTGWPAWMSASARAARSRGKKKPAVVPALPPALSAMATPFLLRTGEPEEPPDVPDAECLWWGRVRAAPAWPGRATAHAKAHSRYVPLSSTPSRKWSAAGTHATPTHAHVERIEVIVRGARVSGRIAVEARERGAVNGALLSRIVPNNYNL
eukprot:scaffold17516_cov134-Isochrysis_galbana.AAC.6